MSAKAYLEERPPELKGFGRAILISVVLHGAVYGYLSLKNTPPPKERFRGTINMVELVPPGAAGTKAAKPALQRPAQASKPAPKAEPKPVVVEKSKPAPKPVAAKPSPQAKEITQKPPPVPPKSVPLKPADPAPAKPREESYSEANLEAKLQKLRQKETAASPARQPQPQRTEADVRSSIERIKSRVGEPPGTGTPSSPKTASQRTEPIGAGAQPGAKPGVTQGTLAEIRFTAYRNKVWAHVKRFWNLPPSLSGRGLSVIVGAAVTRNGVVQKYWVEESSGVEAFDQSALRALINASPLPQVSDDIPDEAFADGLGFRFSE